MRAMSCYNHRGPWWRASRDSNPDVGNCIRPAYPIPPQAHYLISNETRQKITLGKCESGVRGLLVYCADYRCAHAVSISADQWSDNLVRFGTALRLCGLRPSGRGYPVQVRRG